MSLLTNNYFKAFRFEKKLLFINLSTMFLEIVGLFGIHILLKNVEAVMIWTIIVTMIKSIWSELLISRFLNLNLYVDIIFEIIVVVLFILTNLTLSFFYAFIFYSFLLIIFLIFTRQKLRSSISLLRKF
ncbi:polysaccharide transporter [Streptococcus suis]|nr:polysaccharide transporter [Streptococcus suis]